MGIFQSIVSRFAAPASPDFSTVTSNLSVYSHTITNKVYGVRSDYSGSHAQKTLSHLQIGSLLVLAPDNSPTSDSFDGIRLSVFDTRKRQVGFFDIDRVTISLLLNFLPSRKSILQYLALPSYASALVNRIGSFQPSPDEDVIWCEISVSICIYFDPSETLFYIAPNGRIYHANEACKKAANLKVPASHIQISGHTPCSKCNPDLVIPKNTNCD